MIEPYDILMLVVLVGMALFGVWKGMAWQVAALASVILSGLVAINCSPGLAPMISAEEPWNRIIAMLILYVVTAGAIWILFRLTSNVIDRIKLKEFDRQLGAMFGLAKGVLCCVVITFFAVTISEKSRTWVLDSQSGGLIARGIRRANPILPEDVRTWLGEYIDELDEKLHAPPTTPEERESDAIADADEKSTGDDIPKADEPKDKENTPSPATESDMDLKKTIDSLKDLLPKLK